MGEGSALDPSTVLLLAGICGFSSEKDTRSNQESHLEGFCIKLAQAALEVGRVDSKESYLLASGAEKAVGSKRKRRRRRRQRRCGRLRNV